MAFANSPIRCALLVALSGAALLLCASCSERYADAVVLDPQASDAATGTSGSPFNTDAGGPDTRDPGWPDLCQPCENHDDCGGNNDLCLRLPFQAGFYCGMDCRSDGACPEGYECTNVDNSPDDQCTPRSGSCADPTPVSPYDLPSDQEARDYVLGVMNDLRSNNDLEPLRQSDCLDEIASDALSDWQDTGTQGLKFRYECAPYIPDCQCHWEAESQAFVFPQGSSTPLQSLEQPFQQADQPGNEFHQVYDKAWTRVGVAVDFVNDVAFISVEFGP